MSKNDLLAREYRGSVDSVAQAILLVTASFILVVHKLWSGLNIFEHILFFVVSVYGIYTFIEWYILKIKYYQMILEQFNERADAWEDDNE